MLLWGHGLLFSLILMQVQSCCLEWSQAHFIGLKGVIKPCCGLVIQFCCSNFIALACLLIINQFLFGEKNCKNVSVYHPSYAGFVLDDLPSAKNFLLISLKSKGGFSLTRWDFALLWSLLGPNNDWSIINIDFSLCSIFHRNSDCYGVNCSLRGTVLWRVREVHFFWWGWVDLQAIAVELYIRETASTTKPSFYCVI